MRLASGMVGVALGCQLTPSPSRPQDRNGRLSARPLPDRGAPAAGLAPLGLRSGRDGVVYVPSALATTAAVPLILHLHGAGGSAQGALAMLQSLADEVGCVLLVPDSRGPTWDAITGVYGGDVSFINEALSLVFGRFTVDPARVVVAGFSDGASYALAIGRINGDLFTRVVAFSPGFLPAGSPVGKPPIFITHGTNDPVLPLETTSRRIIDELGATGYDVTFRQFNGGHTVPAALAREALTWAVG